MNVTFLGDVRSNEQGLHELVKELGWTVVADGMPIRLQQRMENCLTVKAESDRGSISYREPIHLFRGLGLLAEAWNEKKYGEITEIPKFRTNGVMLDCSRNGVMKPEAVKSWLRKMALMGLNMLMLYTEDTYTIEGEPYFGYMRGRYTPEELKELDTYAHELGIELIPCIQTLAHLASFLAWARAEELRDTWDVLLAQQDATYTFIEKAIASVSRCFRSRRIHIGMDEAFSLGRGKYLDLFGHRRAFDIMSDHLRQVLRITDRYGLSPMIWSDMYFRLGSRRHEYYDLQADIPEDVIRQMPRGVQFVYWDYYHEDSSFYRQFIRMHRRFGSDPVFAGGVWTWLGPAVHYKKTFAVTEAALTACKEEGVSEVFATLWGDDGQETNQWQGLLGLQLFAEHGYAAAVDRKRLGQRFAYCTGGDMDAFWRLGKIDTLPGARVNDLTPDNPSKFLLWQDVLIGLFDEHIRGRDISSYYSRLAEELERDAERGGTYRSLSETAARLCRVLSLKGELGLRIKGCYDWRDREGLARIAEEELPRLSQEVEGLRRAHREQWLSTYKPFGWEVLDLRYGGLIGRIETAAHRIQAYLEGKAEGLEELEADRIGFDSYQPGPDSGIGKANLYSRIATANVMGFR
ncbi:N-acetyl-beta-D-glucosaminidase [Marinithermofilum abyssi]|uniref:N-acetyl-beta-D-glucosaminidase n=1 Tax=Marinithermofilum abyssi TaxID=1571185 RepID=A0A8J2YEE9_9BACL|nr:beta-N-acetylhexosaminidase [Marinithermofilum abyssi]GGE26285.1 N-acetyl-beta-D-glucosaminidase [Marinithermofilum abyssi]